ncbi:DNA-binding response regulator, OmpR family, contains REC and winged-helix (wHTH) domain [Reichenbachiella faecimaris]|uniref:DNA-binding response regulator, OmpR family, contains REC and winged-helix (WHTH) domain n=2 Tax=Reichenbachiella faecimaris TaxID=692418 RepID=A0A1W2GAE9_REIFA|nr:DNA-binding response regulator, OmpR family, contains REC and winged-helix (wHTH) domain [Reichenbachiella faecimaris]
MKILLAEDEPSLGLIVKESLESRDFQVEWSENGEEALVKYKNFKPDILVLDVMMPKKDGFSLARQIRKLDQRTPIIFLTAKSQTKDVVEGFELGGNDYLKKPFSMEELIVRIQELILRRERKSAEEQIEIGAYLFNYPKQRLQYKNEEQMLTHREAEVLMSLAISPNEVVDRSTMLSEIWGNDDFFNARSMDVFITKLRKKLAKDSNIEILNVRGFGYKLVC